MFAPWLKALSGRAGRGRPRAAGPAGREAVRAFYDLTRLEGILPALESSHAVAAARKRARQLKAEDMIVVNLSGRGDKDIDSVPPLSEVS